jgi:predicted metal-dependent enzyme (double-stranded beta helix superfamily)
MQIDRCSEWSEELNGISGTNERIAFFEKELPRLLSETETFDRMLRQIADGAPDPDIRTETMFENELLLYLDRGRRFSLRVFLYDRSYTPIHDHGSWGVSGAFSGKLEVIRYRRLDDGKKDGFAELEEKERRLLSPGETELTLPLDEGIHRTGAPEPPVLVMVSIYGPPMRRLFINRFEPDKRRVERVYPRKIRMKRLAALALEGSATSRIIDV